MHWKISFLVIGMLFAVISTSYSGERLADNTEFVTTIRALFYGDQSLPPSSKSARTQLQLGIEWNCNIFRAAPERTTKSAIESGFKFSSINEEDIVFIPPGQESLNVSFEEKALVAETSFTQHSNWLLLTASKAIGKAFYAIRLLGNSLLVEVSTDYDEIPTFGKSKIKDGFHVFMYWTCNSSLFPDLR